MLENVIVLKYRQGNNFGRGSGYGVRGSQIDRPCPRATDAVGPIHDSLGSSEVIRSSYYPLLKKSCVLSVFSSKNYSSCKQLLQPLPTNN